jgi:hypothetical protein
VRKKEAIIADMDDTHAYYFNCLTEHDKTMLTLQHMKELEQELIAAMGDKYEAYHLEHQSYMQAWYNFKETK